MLINIEINCKGKFVMCNLLYLFAV